jgi:uncharacterized repeat protein (TIGR01451 family)
METIPDSVVNRAGSKQGVPMMEKSNRSGLSRFRGVAVAAAVAGLVACTTAVQPPEQTASTRAAVWTNGGFTTGTAGAAPGTPWATATNLNKDIDVLTPETLAGLQLQTGGTANTFILAGTNLPDADLGLTASLRYCRYNNRCAIVNQHGNDQNVNSLTQSMTIAAGDVDPADGLVHVRFTVAPVLQNPAHQADEQPYYFVQVTDTTKGTILYSDFNLSGAGIAWIRVNPGAANEIDYTNWQLVDVAPGASGVAMGDTVKLDVIGAGCAIMQHWGEVYLDGVGPVIPGLNVEGTGPAQANPGSDITYTFTYKNGGTVAATGTTIDITIPTGTTFQSFTPPAGATCTTPAVGGTGTIVCTFAGAIAAAASGTFTLTVQIDAATTGIVTESNYQIQSTQETTLVGPPINTQSGCTLDSQCPTGDWCDESANTCTPKLTNGTPVPTDTGHTNPTLNGTCTVAAGALVCASGVCDTKDNKCGYANGDGPCTTATAAECRSGFCTASGVCEPTNGCAKDSDCSAADWCDETTATCTPKVANGGPVPTDGAHTNPTLNGMCSVAAGTVVCVSGVCDTKDNDCGYANGDGPCTTATATDCRSGFCTPSGVCEPTGGCAVDSDCTGGDWCDETTATCTAKLSNGTAVPSDPPHMNPTLNGMCSAGAGTLVCASGVCDTKDNECGYADGDGPCTAVNGGTVCRSGSCSATGVCEPAGQCKTDADCTGGKWCDETTSTCTAKLSNGTAIPSDPPHMNPTLNAMCSVGAGTLVCISGVCDPKDNECGYANGDGPCTVANGGTVCRSGACSTNGTCEPTGGCNVNGDCTSPSAPVCNPTTHTCQPESDSGAPVDGGKDTGSPAEAGVDSGLADAGDSGPTADSGSADASAADSGHASGGDGGDASLDDPGFLEGGGISCDVAVASGGLGSGTFAGAVAALALLGTARRRRRR